MTSKFGSFQRLPASKKTFFPAFLFFDADILDFFRRQRPKVNEFRKRRFFLQGRREIFKEKRLGTAAASANNYLHPSISD